MGQLSEHAVEGGKTVINPNFGKHRLIPHNQELKKMYNKGINAIPKSVAKEVRHAHMS
jgi:hypothetical protein